MKLKRGRIAQIESTRRIFYRHKKADQAHDALTHRQSKIHKAKLRHFKNRRIVGKTERQFRGIFDQKATLGFLIRQIQNKLAILGLRTQFLSTLKAKKYQQ